MSHPFVLKFKLDLKVLLIVYLFLFFVPLTTQGYYYEVESFTFILNKVVLAAVFVLLLVKASLYLIRRKIPRDEMFLYLLGIAMLVFNMAALTLVEDMNFVVTGVALLLAPLVQSLSIRQLKNIIVLVLVALLSFATLTMIDFIFSLSLNPLVEIRYYGLTEQFGARFQNNSLFGQGNAFGAILGFLFLLLLTIDSEGLLGQSRLFFYLLLLLSTILLISSFSAGGIIIGFLGLLIWIITKYRYGFIVGLVLFAFIMMFIFSLSFESSSSRKLVSAGLKLERSYQFFLLVSQNPSILVSGFNAYNVERFYTESTYLDMVLNFGIIIPILFLAFLLKKMFSSKNINWAFLYFSAIFFIMTQNSSFLLPSAILLLVAVSLQRKIYSFPKSLV
tara:strand:- start:956 stop:2125 length:1170 start_codon:yes stop_codon:yes gene_type:complete